VDGWVDGWMDGWVGKWMDGWIDKQLVSYSVSCEFLPGDQPCEDNITTQRSEGCLCLHPGVYLINDTTARWVHAQSDHDDC
jgi:hypothetical protein